MKKYDLLINIGRFAPFHNGHQEVLNTAFSLAENVLVLIGSSGSGSTLRTPLSYEIRSEIIRSNFKDDNLGILPLYDNLYNNTAWVNSVQVAVNSYIATLPYKENMKIGIIGHDKDESTFYLNLFPQYELELVESACGGVNATGVRKLFYEGKVQKHELCTSVLSKSTCEILFSEEVLKIFSDLKMEYQFIKEQDALWKTSPYKPTFSTVDALVEHAGHILLNTRRAVPGNGKLSLPGGYVKDDHTTRRSCIYHLKEKTSIKIPEKVLMGSIKNSKIYDHPKRSERGRIITQCFHIELDGMQTQPKISSKAEWVPISDIKENLMFEDHYHIIIDMLGI